MAKRDLHAAVQYTRGAIAYLEQTALDLMAQHTASTDPAEAEKLADEYEACWELKGQLEELITRATR